MEELSINLDENEINIVLGALKSCRRVRSSSKRSVSKGMKKNYEAPATSAPAQRWHWSGVVPCGKGKPLKGSSVWRACSISSASNC